MLQRVKKKVNYLLIRCNFMQSPLYKWLVKVNLFLFHREERQKTMSYGKLNPEKTFYVVQLSNSAGILSTLRAAMSAVRWAELCGYIPIIDLLNDKVKERGYSFFSYFTFKTEYSPEEVYKSKHVILSGTRLPETDNAHFGEGSAKSDCAYMHNYFEKHFEFTPNVWERVNSEQNIINDRTLGVFLRGTDYTAMKPYYHNCQPEVEEVIEQVSDFLAGHDVSNIYLVTEDWNIYHAMKKRFGELVTFSGGEEHFVKDYDGKEYIAEYVENPYLQNLEYITRIILLSRCRWMIGSITNGSQTAVWLNNAKYEEVYLFDKGYYHVQ